MAEASISRLVQSISSLSGDVIRRCEAREALSRLQQGMQRLGQIAKDEGGNHNAHTGQQEGGELIAHRLSRPGGHDPQHVPSGAQSVNQLALTGAEGAVAKVALEQGVGHIQGAYSFLVLGGMVSLVYTELVGNATGLMIGNIQKPLEK